MNHERLEWLGSQPIPNILRHALNPSKSPQRCNPDRHRRTTDICDWHQEIAV
jgi:hypothetical protein